MKDAWNFILRHSTWFGLGLISLLLLIWQFGAITEFIRTLLMICTVEAIALALSSVAIFVYTKLDFTAGIIYGADKKLGSIEQHAFIQVIGNIFLGVHILVGLCVLGVYIAQFTSP